MPGATFQEFSPPVVSSAGNMVFGARTGGKSSGVEMFLAQGIAQWEIWTGLRAPETAMRRAVFAALQSEEHPPGQVSKRR